MLKHFQLFKLQSVNTAFTLAEVLITLAIIGIVAAVTIPSLTQKYEEKQYLIKLKKTYTVLNQAFLFAKGEYGELDYWGLTTTLSGETNEDGELYEDYSGMNKVTAIFKQYLQAEYVDFDKIPVVKSLDGTINQGGSYTPATTETRKNGLRLNDGTIVQFGHIPSMTRCLGDENYCGDIIVFLPNTKNNFTQGKNHFFFYLSPDGVKPMGSREGTAYPFETYCNLSRTDRSNGRGCTAWALENDNMAYLHCTGLVWGGKTKCD